MKRLLALVVWVTVGTSVLALTTAGSATAGIRQGTGAHQALVHMSNVHRPPVHVINLHKAYEARLGHATLGPVAGVVPPVGESPLPGRGGNNCGEPDCPVVYNGGPVQHTPHVYLLLWGPNWLSDPNQAATASYLENFFTGLGVQPEDNWSLVTSQYGDGFGSPTFTTQGVYEGAFNDVSTPPIGVGQAGLAAEADSFTTLQGITDLNDAQIIVATQSGTCPAGFDAPGCAGGAGSYCAWHSSSNEPYMNLPYILDAGSACGENFVNSDGIYDGFSIVAGHEYAEMITDPYPISGWYDGVQPAFGEIADKCAWSFLSHDVTLSNDPFAMQPLWDNSTDSCVIPIGGTSDQVSMANVLDQRTYQKSVLSLPLNAISSGNNPLTWSAKGLPSGLTIDPGTGIISGQLKAAPSPEPYQVMVEVTDTTGALAGRVFNWYVLADTGTRITNRASLTCLQDHAFSIAPGNQIFMWSCAHTANEMFTQSANPGELVVLGQCLTDPITGTTHGGVGTLQVIEPCTGAANQVWFHNSSNQYVLEQNFLCLTNPGGSTVDGAPVKMGNCNLGKAERWSGS